MSTDSNDGFPPVREVSDLAYEVASQVVKAHGITAETPFSPADSISFDRLLEESIEPGMLGDRYTFLRRCGVMRESVWYAGHITGNRALLEKAWAQDTQKIRRRTQKLSGSIALKYGL